MASATVPTKPIAPAPRPFAAPPGNPPIDREATDRGIAQLALVGR